MLLLQWHLSLSYLFVVGVLLFLDIFLYVLWISNLFLDTIWQPHGLLRVIYNDGTFPICPSFPIWFCLWRKWNLVTKLRKQKQKAKQIKFNSSVLCAMEFSRNLILYQMPLKLKVGDIECGSIIYYMHVKMEVLKICILRISFVGKIKLWKYNYQKLGFATRLIVS